MHACACQLAEHDRGELGLCASPAAFGMHAQDWQRTAFNKHTRGLRKGLCTELDPYVGFHPSVHKLGVSLTHTSINQSHEPASSTSALTCRYAGCVASHAFQQRSQRLGHATLCFTCISTTEPQVGSCNTMQNSP